MSKHLRIKPSALLARISLSVACGGHRGGANMRAIKRAWLVGLVLMAVAAPTAAAPISDTLIVSLNGVPTPFPFVEGSAADGDLVLVTSINGFSPTGDASQFGHPTVLLEGDGTI